MSNIEKKQLKSEEIGSYELTEDFQIVRNPEVVGFDFLKNETEVIDDPVRQAVWHELKEKWGKEIDFYDIIKNSDLRAVFYNPDGFIKALNTKQIIVPAERKIQINNIVAQLEAQKDKMIEIRLDYENIKDAAYDEKFKRKIEFAINDIEKYIANGKKFLAEAVSA